jgi:uncharacterized protein YceK
MIITVVLLMSGCATLSLSKDATIAEKAAAKEVDCTAAQALIEQSEAELAILRQAAVLDQDAINYWTVAGSGAKMAVALACGATTAKPKTE